MPELPDVEIFKNYFDLHALNKKIKDVEVFEKKILKNTSERKLQQLLQGNKFSSSERYGKWLFIKISKDKGLAMHFGMTGDLKYYEKERDQPSFTRAIIHFEKDNKLAFADKRKLGGIDIVGSKEELIEKHSLGPDAMEMNLNKFQDALENKKGKVKTVLMDQSVVAGIGNIYADEILFQSKIYPETPVNKLKETDIKLLFKNIKEVLKTAIAHDAERKYFPKNYIIPFRKEGADCPRCGGKVKMTEVGGRSTYFCPGCQKSGKPLRG